MFPLSPADASPFPARRIEPLWPATLLPSLPPGPGSEEQVWINRSSSGERTYGSLSMPKGAAAFQGQDHLLCAHGVNFHPALVSYNSLSGELSRCSVNKTKNNKFEKLSSSWIKFKHFPAFLSLYCTFLLLLFASSLLILLLVDSLALHTKKWCWFEKNAKQPRFRPSWSNWGLCARCLHPRSFHVCGWCSTRNCGCAETEQLQVKKGTDTCWTSPTVKGRHQELFKDNGKLLNPENMQFKNINCFCSMFSCFYHSFFYFCSTPAIK